MLNLTQHQLTSDQITAGVTDLPTEKQKVRNALITFDDLPTEQLLVERAEAVADLAVEAGTTEAMIAGAPFFGSYLEAALFARGILPVYAFSKRVSKEEPDGQGGVKKTNVFVHVGFVPARRPA